jgi:hypothetical protein
MTLEEALELPFDEYMNWRWSYIQHKHSADPLFRIVYDSGANEGGPAFLEAQWAKMYWFNKVNAVCKLLDGE